MPRPIINWSYSALNTYENCAFKFWQVKILKNFSDANQWNQKGDVEHTSIESFMRRTSVLSQALAPLTPLFEKIRDAPGENLVEYKMTIDNQFQPCRGNDWNNAWCRGNADFLKVNGPRVTYFDWKSGKPRDSEDQIHLTSLLVFAHMPGVREVAGTLFYYRHGKMDPRIVTRAEVPRLWNGYLARVHALEESVRNNYWPTNENPLCGWCPVATCQFNKTEQRLAREALKAQQGATR